MHATSSFDTNFRGKCPLSEPPIRELSGLSVLFLGTYGTHKKWCGQWLILINKGSRVGRFRDIGGHWAGVSPWKAVLPFQLQLRFICGALLGRSPTRQLQHICITTRSPNSAWTTSLQKSCAAKWSPFVKVTATATDSVLKAITSLFVQWPLVDKRCPSAVGFLYPGGGPASLDPTGGHRRQATGKLSLHLWAGTGWASGSQKETLHLPCLSGKGLGLSSAY